jgi:hypothetical protein
MRSVSAKLTTAALVAVMCLAFLAVGAVADRDLIIYGKSRVAGKDAVRAEKELVAATVKSYNRVLSDFYASGGVPALLDKFPATKTIKHGVFRDLGYISSAGKVLVYDHAETTPVKITFTAPGRAEALMFEEWNYIYQSRADRKPVSKPQGLGRGFRYTLVRERSGWLVDGWDPVEMAEPGKKKEFLY